MRTRTQNFLHNTLMSALYQIVVMLTGFILPKVMLNCYGSEVNGLITSITQFISYISLVEAGLSGAAVYALYKPLAEENHHKVSQIVVATKRFYAKSGWMFLVLVATMAMGYPFFVKSTQIDRHEISILVFILGFGGIIDFFLLGKYRAILTADQRQFVISLSSLAYCLLNMLLIVIFALTGFSVVWSRLIALIAVLVRSVILQIYCRKNYPYLDYSAPPDNMALNKRWDALFLQVLGTVHTGVPVVLSTLLATLASVSVYSVFNIVINGLKSILEIFHNGLGAGFGDLIVRNETERLQKAYSDFEFSYYAMITLVYAVAMVQIQPFVLLYTSGITDANYNQPLLGYLLTFNGFLYNIKTPQGMLVISAGLYRETRWQTTMQALIAIILGAVLGWKYGVAGILMGMCVSNLYRDIDLVQFIPRHVTHMKICETVKNLIIAVLEMGIIVILGIIIPWDNSSILHWVLTSVAMVAIAVVVILGISVVLRPKQLRNSIRRLIIIFQKSV